MLENNSIHHVLHECQFNIKQSLIKLVIAVKSRWKLNSLCFICPIFLSSCSVLFPAHPNSRDIEKEDVIVQKLKFTSSYESGQQVKVNSFIKCLQNKEKVWDECVIETKQPTEEEKQNQTYAVGIGVAAAEAIIGLAIDAAADAIKKEGTEHEANFGKKGIVKNFWVKKDKLELIGCIDGVGPSPVASTDNCTASFDFLRIIRTTERLNKDKPAFELILYFEENNNEYFVYPIRYITRSAKAKVLDTWCNPFAYHTGMEGVGCAVGYIPPLIAVKFFQNSKSSIQTNALIDMVGKWRTPDQKSHTEDINHIQFSVSDYQIINGDSNQPEMRIFGENGKLVAPIAWATGIPVSQKENGIFTSNGTYELEVKVNEIDSAKENVDKTAKGIASGLSDNKEKITSAIFQKVGGDSKKE
jgi:hypothetical protein